MVVDHEANEDQKSKEEINQSDYGGRDRSDNSGEVYLCQDGLRKAAALIIPRAHAKLIYALHVV